MEKYIADTTVKWEKSDKLFNNPHKGFTTFQRFNNDKLNENWSVETGWKMEELPSREGIFKGDMQGHPETSIAYFRIPWSVLEPKEDEYNLEIIDEILETASLRGQKVMFRFIPHAARPGSLDLPEWFRKKLGLKPRQIKDKLSPNHPLYFERYGKLIRVIGEHIDGDSRITAIDMALVSAWGEQDQIESIAQKDWEYLVDAYMQSFKKTPISAQFNHIPSIEYANTYRPIGARADCLGNMNWHMFALYPKFFDTMDNLWQKAPIAFEVCWVVKHWLDMGWDIDFIISQSLKWHITSFNAKSVAIPEELKGKCEEWIKKMGYRYCINECSYPSKANKGNELQVILKIENVGVAPIYHKYPFVLRLKNSENTYDFETDIDITSILPGEYTFEQSIVLPNDIKVGEYVLQAGIGTDTDRVFIATDSPVDNGFNTISETLIIS